MKIHSDIAYAEESDLQKLDIYIPSAKSGPLPVLIHIHGGAWSYGDKAHTKAQGIFYAKHGIVVVCINYRLSERGNPTIKHPTHIKDCASAVSWVFKNIKKYGGDTNKIYLSGHSSGAHLASLLATDGTYVQEYGISPININGVVAVDTAGFNLNSYMIAPEESNPSIKKMKKIVQSIFAKDKEELLKASPINYINHKTCQKFLVIVSSARPLAIGVSRNFVCALNKSKKEASILEVDGHTHEQMNLAMSVPDNPISNAILSFLNPD